MSAARGGAPAPGLAGLAGRAGLLGLLGLLALVAVGCRDTGIGPQGCRADGDCATSVGTGGAEDWRCDTRTSPSVCYCRDDDACPARQFCNTAGFCQDRAGCTRNSDCLGAGLVCDTGTGTCLPQGQCTSDLHCELGQVCDASRRLCVEGCRSSGDCAGASCRCGGGACACTAGTEAELAQCEIGVCDPGFCANDTFCAFGEKCGTVADAGTDLPQCYSDYHAEKRPYCKACQVGAAGDELCGRGGNFCLIDTVNLGSYYCGVDCSEGQVCPRGYACQPIREFPQDQTCSDTKACPDEPSQPCATDAQCAAGTVCNVPPGATSGFCRGVCTGSEGGKLGVCGCVTDDDCSQNVCTNNQCSRTGKACVGDEDCFPVRCVDTGTGYRACRVGLNCAPANGLTCLDLR